MLTYDLISLSRIKHEEMIADAEKWSGRAYGFYPELPALGTENRIVAAFKSLFARKPTSALKTTKPALTAPSQHSLRAATK